MNWQTFLNTLLGIVAAALPFLAIWFKLWINDKIEQLKAKSAVNSGRIDQHDILQGVVTTENGAQNRLVRADGSMADPPAVSADDVHAQYTPSQVDASEAMSAARSRVGQVVDPHDAASAVIHAQSGLK